MKSPNMIFNLIRIYLIGNEVVSSENGLVLILNVQLILEKIYSLHEMIILNSHTSIWK